MKIACVSTSRVPADTANSIQVMKTCHGLAREGHAVHLFIPRDGRMPGEDWEMLAERYGLTERFEITWLSSNPRLRRGDFALNAVRQAARTGATLLYTWTIQAAVFGLLVSLPVAYELHDLPTGRLGPLWYRAFLRLRGRKRLLPITAALRLAAEQRYGAVPDAQVVVVPNGVDLDQYDNLPAPSAARAALGLPESLTVMCSGHLYAGRGVDLFLELSRRFPKASFVWVGGRVEEVDFYRAEAAGAGIDNVLFTGFINQRQLPAYQAAADVLLMPYARSIAGSGGGNSADICSPMKMFDYLAAGRAILSSDLPVIHEVLNETNAMFALPEDAHAWASALERLLTDADLRCRLAERAAVDAQQFSWRARAARALSGIPQK